MLILIGLFDSIFRAKDLKVLNNPISILIFLYFLFVGVQVALSMLYYRQSLIGGVIGVRDQLYYLSFFLFLLRLDDTDKMIKIMEMLSVVGYILVVLAVVNYFGPTVFYSKFAEGAGIRSGVRRAWVSGMMLLSFVALWQYCRSVVTETKTKKSVSSVVIFLAIHLFRQTRTRTLTLVFLMGSILILNGKLKYSVFVVFLGALTVGVAQIFMEENIIINTFESAIEDVAEDQGTWGARMDLARSQINEFVEHPLLGSGKTALAGSESFRGGSKIGRVGEVLEKSTNVHAGYSSWLLGYGLVGAIWLVCFIWLHFALGVRTYRNAVPEEKALIMFGLSYLGFIITTSVSMNHLQYPVGIIYICLASAIVVRIFHNQKYRAGQR